jgi:glucokinase
VTKSAFLVGDVGATNARLALARFAGGALEWLHEARCSDAALRDFDAALDALFAASPLGPNEIRAACLGVAGPISGRRARFTNRDWVIDADAVAAALGGAPVTLVNDLEAAASGLDFLPERDFAVLQRRPAAPGGVRLVIGAGTGLGIAYAVACGERRRAAPRRSAPWGEAERSDARGETFSYRIVASEGGHAGFAPANARQRWLADALRGSDERLEAEHVVCGAGLERIYRALRAEDPAREAPALRAALERGGGPAAISHAALAENDPLASDALDLFVDCYGSVAGDHALAVLPHGGVFVVGGIAAKILPRLEAGGFVRAFTAKGNFARLAGTFPIAVVTNERLGLAGAARIARDSVAATPEGRTPP